MIYETVESYTPYHLRYAPDDKGGEKTTILSKNDPEETIDGDGRGLLCRKCRWFVTSENEQIAVQGSHRHTFANPHGIVFEIGCFRSASGCGSSGPLTAEWSWFKDFSWLMAHCRRCMVHLGWQYVSPAGETFFGLIMDQLVWEKENGIKNDG